MKKLYLIKTVFFLLFFSNIQATEVFKKVYGSAYDLDINHDNGIPVVVGKSGNIFIWNDKTNRWKRLATPNKPARRVAYRSGTIVIRSDDLTIQKFKSGRWYTLRGKAKDLTIAKNGKIIIIDEKGKIEYWNKYKKRFIRHSIMAKFPQGIEFSRISSEKDNKLLLIAKNGAIYEVNATKVKKIKGGALDVCYDHNNRIFIAGKNSGKIWFWRNNDWVNVSNKYSPIALASGKKGTWFIKRDNSIYRQVDNSTYRQVHKAIKKEENKAVDKRNKEGIYQVTIKKIIKGNLSDFRDWLHFMGGDKGRSSYYGVMGIRMYVLNNTSKKEVTAYGGARPRVWDYSKKSPIESEFARDGLLIVNASRKFVVTKNHLKGENTEVAFNVQANIGESDLFFNDNYRWNQISINLSDLDFSRYNTVLKKLIVVEEGKEKKYKLDIHIEIEKIK